MMNENTMQLLKKGYLQEGEESWNDIAKRVSEAISKAEENDQEKYAQKFYEAISNMDFIPSTPCLVNAGTTSQQLSSCFILDLRDNIESIYEAKAEMAKIFQKNGGAGLNISVLRPTNSPVETSGGQSCGILGFMEEFNLTADIITRNNLRKGALKIDISDYHPDIIEFIKCKDDTDKYTFMNISVALSDKFMNAVKNNEDWNLEFPTYSENKDIYNNEWNGDIEEWKSKGYPTTIYKTIKAKELYYKIMEHAWKTGEPGVSFLDNMNKGNPNPHLGKTNKTNPCSEFNSIPYNSCNLGSVNLSHFVDNGKTNYSKLSETITTAVRFLDNMITVNKLPLEKIDKTTNSVRSIGLGTMGLADMLYQLDIPYGSKESINHYHELYKFISTTAIQTSIDLAKEKGCYPEWENSKWARDNIKIRNSNLLSIAPNGSIGFIANTSGGLEPNYALCYSRRMNDGTIFNMVNPIFEKKLKDYGIYNEKIINKIIENNGSCQGIKEIPSEIQRVFVIASDLSPEQHLEALTTIQKYVDLSVSKTINLSNEATIEDIESIYFKAWEDGAKGTTIYRDGSRENQTLSTNRKDITSKSRELNRGDIICVSDDLLSAKRTITNGCGKFYLHVDFDETTGEMLETFIDIGSGGGCERNLQFISRLISMSLRIGATPEMIIDQANSIRPCIAYVNRTREKGDTSLGTSCPMAIGCAIKELNQKIFAEYFDDGDFDDSEFIKDDNITTTKKDDLSNKVDCPECGEPKVRHEGGCVVCINCGWSKCN